jgi:hypothetical protein
MGKAKRTQTERSQSLNVEYVKLKVTKLGSRLTFSAL